MVKDHYTGMRTEKEKERIRKRAEAELKRSFTLDSSDDNDKKDPPKKYGRGNYGK